MYGLSGTQGQISKSPDTTSYTLQCSWYWGKCLSQIAGQTHIYG